MTKIQELEAQIEALKKEEADKAKTENEPAIENETDGSEITLEQAQEIVNKNKELEKQNEEKMKEKSELEIYKLEVQKTMGELSAQSKEKDKQISKLISVFEKGNTASKEDIEKEKINDNTEFIKNIKSFIK